MDNRIDAIYGRQSIDKKDSISIESQFEFCRYELKGGEGKEYKDKGYSGKNIERPDFQRLLQDIRLGLIKRVIVYKLDRISRSIVDFAKLMELFKQYDVEFVSCTEKFDTSTPMGRAMLNICIVFAQLERESIQMRVQDAFYSRCAKGYYMRGRTPYGFDTEPIVMDGIKTKKLVENAEMDFAELMFQMYAEPGNSYGDITRYFVKHSIKVYDKALQRAFISKLLRNPVYVQADMDIYEYFKAQGVKIESPPEMFTGDNSCYLYQGREGEEQILVIAPHQGRISSQLWLTVQRKLSQNTSFQNGRKCHNTWLAGKIKCGRCGYALVGLRAQNGVVYLRCKQRAENGSCEGAGTLTAQSMEAFVYGEMVKKMQKFHTLKGGKEQSYNPKLTAARVALAKTESEIEKLLDTLSGANPLLLQYANNRIEELEAIHLDFTEAIEPVFNNTGITKAQFERDLHFFHEAELVDLCNDKAARISDQSFRNFLIKYIFVDKKLISLSLMIETCFTINQASTISACNILMNVFLDPTVQSYVLSQIESVWDKIEGDKSSFIPFFKAFHMVRPTQTLILLKSQIEEMPAEPFDVQSLQMERKEPNANISDYIIEALCDFQNHNDLPTAIDLLLLYYAKKTFHV